MMDWALAKHRGWRARSRHAQVEASIWWSLGTMPWITLLAGFPQLLRRTVAEPLPQTLAWSVLGLTVAACVLSLGAQRQSLDSYLDARPSTPAPLPRPYRARLCLLGGLTAAAATLLMTLTATERMEGGAVPAAAAMFSVVTPLLCPLALVMTVRNTVSTVAGIAAAAAAALAAVGVDWAMAVVHAMVVMIGGGFVLFTVRCSAWYVVVMRELDEARDVQTRLAVAEERLRFGRDLHDVMGRNMSVMALKSELAVRLVERGSASAADQMVEVQRIARDSQREIQEVVRGYREADFLTELAGARAILRAAGIDCRTDVGTSGALPDPVRSALGWVVREGTTNVLRHANATRCTIALRLTGERAGKRTGPETGTGGTAMLTMENDGTAQAASGRGAGTGDGGGPGGSGLAGLRERLAALGGTLTAEHGHGGTYGLTAQVPLAGEAASEPEPEPDADAEPESQPAGVPAGPPGGTPVPVGQARADASYDRPYQRGETR